MAMQVGDATRQRLEHVKAALSRSLACEGGVAPASVQIAEVARLEAAQLTGVSDDFGREIVGIESAISQLAIDARSAMAESRELYGGTSGSAQSSLAAFSADLANALAAFTTGSFPPPRMPPERRLFHLNSSASGRICLTPAADSVAVHPPIERKMDGYSSRGAPQTAPLHKATIVPGPGRVNGGIRA